MNTVKSIQDVIINKIIPDCIDYDFCPYEHYGNDFVNVHVDYQDFPYMGEQVQESFINITYRSDVSLALGSGSYPDTLSDRFNNIEEGCYSDFLKAKDLLPEQMTESLQEEYFNEWNNYASDCLDYFYTVRIFIKDGTVKIISGTNTDFTYGRFCANLIGSFEKEISFNELTFELLEDSIQNAFQGI